MPKVLFVATVVKTHIMEFHLPYLKMFKEQGWETAVAAKNDYENAVDCVIPYCDMYYDIPFERNPLTLSNIVAYKKLKKIMKDSHYDIIHCHTPVGGMLGRFAARKTRRYGTRVMYTAHGFHFYKGAPLLNWLVYYPLERIMAHYTDVLITINNEDYKRAQKFHARQVYYVPGVGIDLDKFAPITDRVVMQKELEERRTKLGLEIDDFVILSVGELIKRKNHETVIRAMAEIKTHHYEEYQMIKCVICGRGVLEEELKQLAKSLGVETHVYFLGYRNDICQICHASDLFVFMSLQEGLPVALMEAMACGLPVICTPIRGNVDLVKDGETGLLCENVPEKVAEKILLCLHNNSVIKDDINERLKNVQEYSLQAVSKKMYQIYFRLGD